MSVQIAHQPLNQFNSLEKIVSHMIIPFTLINQTWHVLCFYAWFVICINTFAVRGDEYIDTPYNFNTLAGRQVMRIKKKYQLGVIGFR